MRKVFCPVCGRPHDGQALVETYKESLWDYCSERCLVNDAIEAIDAIVAEASVVADDRWGRLNSHA